MGTGGAADGVGCGCTGEEGFAHLQFPYLGLFDDDAVGDGAAIGEGDFDGPVGGDGHAAQASMAQRGPRRSTHLPRTAPDRPSIIRAME
jgi:hypothetical protein